MRQIDSLRSHLVRELGGLLDAERRLARALAKMAALAATSQLKAALQKHFSQTEQHVKRLVQAFKHLGETPNSGTSQAMRVLIDEGATMMSETAEGPIRDAVLITAAQNVEHYEMARYGQARTYAQIVGAPTVARLLGQTLKEEKAAVETLAQIAERSVNRAAAAEWHTEQADGPWFDHRSRSSRRARRRRARPRR